MIRYHDRKTITRSVTKVNYFSTEKAIFIIANELFDVNWNGKPIRLLGVTAQGLIERDHAVEQLTLFDYKYRIEDEIIHKLINEFSDKYQKTPVNKMKHEQKKITPTTSFQKDFLDDYKKFEDLK